MEQLQHLFWHFNSGDDRELVDRRYSALSEIESGSVKVDKALEEYNSLLDMTRDDLVRILLDQKVLHSDLGAPKDLLMCHLDVMIRDMLFQSERLSKDETNDLLQEMALMCKKLLEKGVDSMSVHSALEELKSKPKWRQLQCYHIFQVPLGDVGIGEDPGYGLYCSTKLVF